MKIGILGTGNIGKTLVTRLSQAGHEVKVANSRGPETIDPGILSSGARAVKTEDALVDVDAVILSAQAATSRRRRSMLQRKKSVPSSPMPQHAMGPIQRTTL
ncbi:MAG: hypothetical protein EOO31_01065 [Comamonadaceae bacterium]|nr:MAG: hypothetical protein EOO31_01065 [Comamonadaceae bacterium]